jgi:hypothetical protein
MQRVRPLQNRYRVEASDYNFSFVFEKTEPVHHCFVETSIECDCDFGVRDVFRINLKVRIVVVAKIHPNRKCAECSEHVYIPFMVMLISELI